MGGVAIPMGVMSRCPGEVAAVRKMVQISDYLSCKHREFWGGGDGVGILIPVFWNHNNHSRCVDHLENAAKKPWTKQNLLRLALVTKGQLNTLLK